MNKGMIIVGILLIAGLSFAIIGPPPGTWQYPWQAAVFDRYTCSLYSSAVYKMPLVGNYFYPYYATYSQMVTFANAANYMLFYLLSPDGMYYDYYVAPFRADMISYNSNSAAFNAVFNAMLRNYIAQTGPGGQQIVMAWLQGYQLLYNDCLINGPPEPQ